MPQGPLAVLLAYLIGSLAFGYWWVKLRVGTDIRSVGSGATGATNVSRAAGPAAGLLVLALDLGKGYVAVWLAARLVEDDLRWMAAAAVACIVGHSYPIFIRFRGGKSVATGVGVFLFFTPWAVATVVGVWLVVVLLWRYVALGSILATATYPLVAYALYQPQLPVVLAGVVGACLIIFRHRSNIQRMMQGTENRFSLRERTKRKDL